MTPYFRVQSIGSEVGVHQNCS